MSRLPASLRDALLHRDLLSEEQLREVEAILDQTGASLLDTLVRLGYADRLDNIKPVLLAEALGVPFIDVSQLTVPLAVIELVPESVARENVILPLAVDADGLRIAMADPTDVAVIQKLEFILNKPIRTALADREQLIEAINRHYGQTETESVDSMMMEFTDTAIDVMDSDDVCISPEEPPRAAISLASVPAVSAPEPVERRAHVRYYDRMNPERMFPLLVVLSKGELAAVAKRRVAQASSGAFQVQRDSMVEVEPILPGCDCYPRKERIRIGEGDSTATFWVVPRVLGQVMQARVLVRQRLTVLAEVPLDIVVRRKTLALVLGAFGLLLPLLMVILKQFRLDLESQMQDGFPLVATILNWLMKGISPEALGGGLLLLAGVAYLWLRPRKRDVFWDIDTQPRTAAGSRTREEPSLDGQPQKAPSEWLAEGKRHLAEKQFHEAQRCYEHGLESAEAKPTDFARAAVTAWGLGNVQEALAIMRRAEERFGKEKLTGPMWFNMGCFATKLGLFAEAMSYLNRAVESGYTNPQKYLSDADLEPLRQRREFQRLIASIDG